MLLTLKANFKSKQRFLGNLWKFYYRYYTSNKISSSNDTKTVVFFNIHSRTSERHISFLLYCFNRARVKIKLMNNPHFLGNARMNAENIASLEYLKLTYKHPDPKQCQLLVTDKLEDLENINYSKKIVIRTDSFHEGSIRPSQFLMPFFMAPSIYFSGLDNSTKELGMNNLRRIKIFFSGNLNLEQYDNPKLKKLFGKMTRVEIIETLKENLEPENLLTFTKIEPVLKGEYKNKFVFSEWARKSMNQKSIEGRVNSSDWIKTLSKVDFFLACPGFIQPMCHNVIEAMSVGAIPILEHPEFFNPPLQHEVNAIVFNGKEDLLIKINNVLKKTEEEIIQLRANVLKYYEAFLTPESVARGLLEFNGNCKEMFIIESSYYSALPLNK